MPELPEVETVRQDLRQKILHKKISRLEILKSKFSAQKNRELEKIVQGSKIIEIDRYGKLLVFSISIKKSEFFILVHLKMTGQLLYQHNHHLIAGGHSFSTLNTHLPDKHTQAIFYFSDNSKLFFNDLRRFGYIKLVMRDELSKIITRFGIEPLKKNFSLKNFSQLITKKKMVLKALLINQSLIAGIGNIYADEICFCAEVLPHRKTSSLTSVEIKKLYTCSKAVIRKAIKYRGTTFNSYMDSEGNKGKFLYFLNVYGREGELCRRCKKTSIKKQRVGGRGTHFCKECQI